MILRWQLLSLRNGLRTALADHLREVLPVTAAALLLATYVIASLYTSLQRIGPAVRPIWSLVALAAIAAVILAGLASGRASARWAARRAHAPWLAVLPWPAAARRRATRVAALAVGGVLMPLPAFCGLGVSHAVAAPHQGLATILPGLCFMIAFTLAARPARLPDGWLVRPSAVQRRPALLWRLTEGLDRRAPRWVGAWAQGDNGWSLSIWWIASLGFAGGVATAVTLARSWVLPSVATAVLGGNLAYVAALRATPVLSSVLRSSPVGFGAAWAGLVRRPLALSFGWFGIAVTPAFAVSVAAWAPVLAGAGSLLLLNLLFTSATAAAPQSRRQAILLYAAGLYAIVWQGLQYGLAVGGLVTMAVLGVAALLWLRSRWRFRGQL